LVEYLQKTYPTEEFIIESRDYKNFIQLGDFEVRKKSAPNRWVTYRVKKDGEIIQIDEAREK